MHQGRKYLEIGITHGVPLVRIASTRSTNDTSARSHAFGSDTLRTLCAQYYHREGHKPPPAFFRENTYFNSTLVAFIRRNGAAASPFRVKEIGAGSYDVRWEKLHILDQLSGVLLDVTATDYGMPSAPH